jgi:hypothetical protein
MKIAVLSSHVLWPYHYETELEIMQNHLDAGDEVIQLACNRSFGICDSNLDHNMNKCLACISKRECGKNLLKGSLRTKDLLSYADAASFEEASRVRVNFDSLISLQEYHVGDFPLGYAVGSTLVSILRDSTLDVGANKPKISALIKYALLAYRASQRFIELEKPERVYVFNGRIPVPRAMLSACNERSVDCYVHERGCNFKRYELYKNNIPQDLVFIQSLIEKKWNDAEEPLRTEIGKEFFIKRRNGQEQAWISFIKGQQDGSMPADWDQEKHNIVIFNSSEDEFMSCTDDWKNKLYMSQYDAIRRICRDLSNDENLRIYLRCHPNLRGASDAEKRELESMKKENLFYIDPNSEISTYALLDRADVVLTFNSTVGIEATFWNKPSVLAGPSLYDRLGSNYLPSSHVEVLDLLKRRNLPTMPKEGAIKYGYYFNSFGIPFKYYQPINLVEGTFKGKVVQPFTKTDWRTLQNMIITKKSLKSLQKLIHYYHISRVKSVK